MPAIKNLKAFLFFYFSAMTIIVSYLPVYFQEAGLTSSQIGVLLAVGPLAGMICQPILGYLTDKLKSSKKIILICLVLATFFSVPMFFISSYYILVVIAFLFFAFMSPLGGLGDSLTQKTAYQYSTSFGAIRLWGSVGFAVMSLLGGYLLDSIGVRFIYIPFLLFMIITVIFSLKIKDTESSKAPVNFSEVLNLVKNKKFMFFLLLMMFITITHRTNDSFLGIYLIEKGGTESFIGWAWFIGVISEAFIFATAPFWFRRFHSLTFIIIAGILFSFRWFAMGIIEDVIFVFPLQLLHGLTFGIFYLCAFHYISEIVPKNIQSTGHLLFYSFFFGLSGVLGSSIGGVIIEQINAAYLYSILGYAAFLGAIFIGLYKYVFFHRANSHSFK